jgi:hypothetical protein
MQVLQGDHDYLKNGNVIPILILRKIPMYILVLRLLSMTSIFILLLWMGGSLE